MDHFSFSDDDDDYLDKVKRSLPDLISSSTFGKWDSFDHSQDFLFAVFQKPFIQDIFHISQLIIRNYNPDQYFYLGIGSSPALVIAGLQALLDDTTIASIIPLSLSASFDQSNPQKQELLRKHFNLQLKKVPNKKILVIDYIVSGNSLKFAINEFSHFFSPLGLEVEGLALSNAPFSIDEITKVFPGKKCGCIYHQASIEHSGEKNGCLLALIQQKHHLQFRPHPKYMPGRETSSPHTTPSSLIWHTARAYLKSEFNLLDSSGVSSDNFHIIKS